MDARTDVTVRMSLPPHIRNSLIDCPRATWSHHPLFGEKAAFFLGYHQMLRDQAANLKAALEDLLNEPGIPITGTQISRVSALGKELVQHAEHHHRMEDLHYFPVFVETHPILREGIELLGSDHLILGARLRELGRAVSLNNTSRVEYGHLAFAYESADRVARVLGRHLQDEEEVIIPIFLGVT